MYGKSLRPLPYQIGLKLVNKIKIKQVTHRLTDNLTHAECIHRFIFFFSGTKSTQTEQLTTHIHVDSPTWQTVIYILI